MFGEESVVCKKVACAEGVECGGEMKEEATFEGIKLGTRGESVCVGRSEGGGMEGEESGVFVVELSTVEIGAHPEAHSQYP